MGRFLDIARTARCSTPAGSARRSGCLWTIPSAALDEAVLAAMVDTLSGAYRPLPELLRPSLVRRAQLEGDPAGIDEAMERVKWMPPYPGAAQAIERLRGAGLEVGVLTNSAREAADQALEAADLRELMAVVVGTDDVRVYKPHPDVYRRGIAATGARAEEICVVAAHWWDVLGAGRAGIRTAWVAHKKGIPIEAAGDVDVRAGNPGGGGGGYRSTLRSGLIEAPAGARSEATRPDSADAGPSVACASTTVRAWAGRGMLHARRREPPAPATHAARVDLAAPTTTDSV